MAAIPMAIPNAVGIGRNRRRAAGRAPRRLVAHASGLDAGAARAHRCAAATRDVVGPATVEQAQRAGGAAAQISRS